MKASSLPLLPLPLYDSPWRASMFENYFKLQIDIDQPIVQITGINKKKNKKKYRLPYQYLHNTPGAAIGVEFDKY